MPFGLKTKATWPELQSRLRAARPDVEFVFAEPPSVAWTDGPAEGSVVAALGDLTGWQVGSTALGAPPDATLRLSRSLSARAVAVAVVRFRASSARPYSSERPEARERLWAIAEEDDPARREYPLVDAMVDVLLGAHEGDVTADALSVTLQRVGYDALWNEAWASALCNDRRQQGVTMPDRDSYTPGTPSWIDVQTSDQEAAKRFYGGLFGWTYDDQPMPQGPVYSMGTIRGRHVAAIAPLPPQQGIPPHWNTYVTVSDVDATTARVPDAGGTVVMPGFDVMDAGRMAVCRIRPAPCSASGSRRTTSARRCQRDRRVHLERIADERRRPGRPFYVKLFGWKAAPFEGMDYTIFENEGAGIGGAMKSPVTGPARVLDGVLRPWTTPTPPSPRPVSSAAPW